MTCSIVTCSMNRNQNLVSAIDSWLKLNVDEIVIVDWSSEIEVKHTFEKHQVDDPRIKIVRVENEQYWNLSRAFNLGFKHASSEKILKVDSEIEIAEDFFEHHELRQGIYYRGDWEKVECQTQIYANGFFYIYKNNLTEINGFSEYIELYGYDDIDLYERLEGGNSSLIPKFVNEQFICHIEHEDQDRVVNNYKNPNYAIIPDILRSIPGFLVLYNEYLSKRLPSWGEHANQTKYRIDLVGENLYSAKAVETFSHAHHERSKADACYYAVLKYLSWFVSPKVYNLDYSAITQYMERYGMDVSWEKMRLDLNL